MTTADVDVPAELLAALARDAAAHAVWHGLPPSHRREHASYVAEAKKPETRERRAGRCVEILKAG
jgi:uncharacterized protein YdeI (YjbR/CyaY-like superfamily)